MNHASLEFSNPFGVTRVVGKPADQRSGAELEADRADHDVPNGPRVELDTLLLGQRSGETGPLAL